MSIRTRLPRQAGFTITEVLVSIFVLVTGTLGAAGLNLSTQRALQRASLQGTALNIAAAIADRLRAADRPMLSAAVANGYLPLDYRASSGIGSAGADCYASACDASAMTAFDVEEWKARVRNELPEGRVQVCPGSESAQSAEEIRGWQCPADAKVGGDASGVSLVIKIGWREKSALKNSPEAPDPDSNPMVVLVAAYAGR